MHDACDELVSHDVHLTEAADGDALDVFESAHGIDEAAGATAFEVYLAVVARDDHLAALTEPREEHQHLLLGGVLRFVENNDRVIKRAAAHAGDGQCERLPIAAAR